MRNKVKNNIARSIIAMLLTLVMIAGSFSIAVFADTESVSGDTKAAPAAEKAEKADQAEKAEKSEPEEKTEKTEPEEKTEKSEPEEKTEKADSVEKTDGSEPEEKEETTEPVADTEKGEQAEAVAVMPMAAAVRDAKNAEAGFAVNFNSDDVTVVIDDDGTVVKPGDKVEAGKTLYLSPKPDACDYELSVSKADGSAVEVSEDEDTFTMPESDVTVSVTLYYNFTLDLSAEDVPDGFYVVVGGTKISKGEKGTIKAEAGKAVPVSEIADLGKDYNYAQDRPSGKHQLKMLISSGGSSKKITLDSFRNYTMPEANTKASLYVLHGWITKFSGDARSCSLTDDSDSDAPWYGHAGDRISIHMFSSNFKSLEVTVKDDQDNVIYSSSQIMENYTFTMPASIAYIYINGVANKAQYNVTVRPAKYGTVKVGSKQFERDLVELEVVPDEGYALSLTGVLIMYKQGDKTNAIKADIVKKGSNKFTFRMPSADVTVATAFSVPRYVNVVTNKGGKVTVDYNNPYGDYTTKNKSVRLKVTPKKGYKLKAWIARTSDGKNLDINKNGEFDMPDMDVTVSAVFGKIKSGNTSGDGGTYSDTGGDTNVYEEPYYTGEVIEDDGEEVVENITPEELINLVPITSMITAQTVLTVTTGISLMLAS